MYPFHAHVLCRPLTITFPNSGGLAVVFITIILQSAAQPANKVLEGELMAMLHERNVSGEVVCQTANCCVNA